MYSFEYHRPASQKDAEDLLKADEGASILAGGQTLLPTLKHRLAQPSALVDLKGIDALNGVSKEGDHIVIGATTTHDTVAQNSIVLEHCPVISSLAGNIGDQQVRHRGTIGGSVANNDPAADYPAACLGLNATIQTNRREIAADDFFLAMFETALEEGEIILSIRFPVPTRAAYIKFRNPASRYAMVGVMVADTIGEVRVAVTGAGSDGVFRDSRIEADLTEDFSPSVISESGVGEDDLVSDMHGSAEYRRHMIAEMARRAVSKAGEG